MESLSGHEAYFALLAHDLLQIANDFGKNLAEVHTLFYEVSCNRDHLQKYLKAEMNK